MIPSITFGRCTRCGNQGGDYSSPGAADAPARDTTGRGFELKLYKGKYLCPICIIDLQDIEDGDIEMQKHEQTQRFLSKSGFQKTIT